jgi:5S rRNA maturation endonuclease (ribonuclease M5)
MVEQMHAALTSEHRTYLREQRMLSDEVIDRYRLGMDEQGGGDRVTIPVADAKGVYRDVRRWLPIEKRRQGTAKMLLWTQGYGGARLFPIDQLEHDVVVLVEGELDALACISHGIPAITATTGALTWPDHLSVPFKEKDVVILPDADPAGRKGAQKRAQSLRKAGAQVRVVSWPEKQPEGWDATDELHGRGVDSLRALIDTASFPNDETADGAQDKKRESQAVALVQLASQSTELFHDETDTPYACLWIGDHRQIWCLDSPRFRRWLARRLFEEEGKVPSGEALSTAMNRWRVKQSSTEPVIRFTCALPGTRTPSTMI